MEAKWINPITPDLFPNDAEIVLVKVKGEIGVFLFDRLKDRFVADTHFMDGHEREPQAFRSHEIQGWMRLPE